MNKNTKTSNARSACPSSANVRTSHYNCSKATTATTFHKQLKFRMLQGCCWEACNPSNIGTCNQLVRADLYFAVVLGGSHQVGSRLRRVCQLVASHGPADAAQLVVHLCQLAVSDEHRLPLGAAQSSLQLLLRQLHMTVYGKLQWCTMIPTIS